MDMRPSGDEEWCGGLFVARSFEYHSTVAHELIVASAYGSVIDKDDVFVFGFIEIAVCGGGGAGCFAVVHEKVVEIVVALLEQCYGFVGFALTVVGHEAVGGEAIVGPGSVQVDVAAGDLRTFECEVGEDVVGGDIDVGVAVGADDEGAVLVFGGDVVFCRSVFEECGVIIGVEPLESVYIEGGDVEVEDFELVVFVSGVEDKLATVGEFYFFIGYDVGFGVDHAIVVTAVLHHDGVELAVGVDYFCGAVVDGHCDLLMGFIDVDVGVGAYGCVDVNACFGDVEADGDDRFWFVAFVVVDGEHVVAGEFERDVFVGYGEPIVGVEEGGIEAFFKVFDGLSVEAVEVV